MTLYIIACICFEMGSVFYNAFLPDIAPPKRIGRISGQAWGRGLFGWPALNGRPSWSVLYPQKPRGLASPKKPMHTSERQTSALRSGLPSSASLPLFYLPQTPAQQTGDKLSLAASYRRIMQTFRELQHYREIFKLLLARLVYNDGLITVFAFGGIYAAGTFGFTFEEVLFFGIIVNIAAGIGAWCFGLPWTTASAAKLTIQITLVGFVIAGDHCRPPS